MSHDNLSIERDGAVATLWLDRPAKLNALDRALWHSIPKAVSELDADEEVRVIVLAGKGKGFCGGIDLMDHAPSLSGGGSLSGRGESPAGKRRALYEDIRVYQQTASCFANTNKPVIAAVHGACIGGGMDLITACDLRLAAADAVFSVRETKIAIVADIGSLQRLPDIVGEGPAREPIFTGKDIDAARAHEIGLVNAVLPDAAALFAAARGMAEEIAANSPLVVQGAKHVLGFSRRRATDAELDYVALWNAAFLHSEDLGEAMQAMMQRRKPNYRGQ